MVFHSYVEEKSVLELNGHSLEVTLCVRQQEAQYSSSPNRKTALPN